MEKMWKPFSFYSKCTYCGFFPAGSGVKDVESIGISWNKNKHNNRTCDQIRSSLTHSLVRLHHCIAHILGLFFFPSASSLVATRFLFFGLVRRRQPGSKTMHFFSFGLPQIVLECGRLRSYRARSRCDTINVSTCFIVAFLSYCSMNDIFETLKPLQFLVVKSSK